MADIGRSTVAHIEEPDSALADLALVNWGRWQQCLSNPLQDGINMSPTFREYVSKYPSELQERIFPSNTAAAEVLDAHIARMHKKHAYCLVLNYVLRQSSRNAARTLTYISAKEDKKLKCTYQTYLNWLNNAQSEIELLGIDILTI